MPPIVANLTSADVPQVLEISLECGLCLWSADAYLAELDRDDSIMLKISDATSTIGFAAGRIFNFAPPQFTVELTNIGIRQTFRNQGLGGLLLRSFLDNCKDFGVSSVILEVRASNQTAIRFYRKFGFNATGQRRGFYSNPFEDALTMRLEIYVEKDTQN